MNIYKLMDNGKWLGQLVMGSGGLAILEDQEQRGQGKSHVGKPDASTIEEAPSTQVVRATQSVHGSQPLSSAIPVLTQLYTNRVAMVAKMEVTYKFNTVGSPLTL